MKKSILSFSLLIFLLTGCSANKVVNNSKTIQNNSHETTKSVQTDAQQPKINNSQNINEKLADEKTSTTAIEMLDEKVSMLSYANKDNNFSIDYPQNLKYKEGKEFNYAFHVFFSNKNSQFGILPQGELDRGLPQIKPLQKKIIIDTRPAIRKEWTLENGNILIIINFLEYPKTWNKDNRLEITSQQKDIEMFNKMLNSFKFVE